MTYKKNGTEYLEAAEADVYRAIVALTRAGRAANNSQIANRSGWSRYRVAKATLHMSARGFIRDTGKGSAYRWRTTGKLAQSEAGPLDDGSVKA